MQLARFLNSVFKKDGFILVDANSKSYIIGNPEKENPIKVKILKSVVEIHTIGLTLMNSKHIRITLGVNIRLSSHN